MPKSALLRKLRKQRYNNAAERKKYHCFRFGKRLDALLGHRGAATVSLLFALSDGAKRFGVLRSQMGRMSQKTLVAELRALEQLGAVERIVFAEIPPRVEYSLTAAGEELVPLLRAVETWCARRTGKVE